MKKLISSLLLLSSTLSYATDACLPPAPETPGVVTQICENLVHQENNTCPEREYKDQFPSAPNMEILRAQADAKFAQLGVKLQWSATSNQFARWQNFSNTPEDIARAKRVMNIAYHALSLYPVGSLKKAGLENLQFTKQYEAVDVNNKYTIRSAGPFPRSRTMIYAENDDIPCSAGMELRMHHELFHLIEGKHLGSMTPKITKWNDLNPKGFTYGNGGHTAYGLTGFKNLEHPTRGFATEYSTFGAEEDRCEIFGKLMTEGYAKRLEGWTGIDPILKSKVDYLKDFMRRKVSDDMDDSFYQKLIPSSEQK